MSAELVAQLQARVTLLDRRLQLLSDEFSNALGKIEGASENEPASGRLPVSEAAIEFEADRLSEFAQGFYQREYDRTSQMFRWTGDGPLVEFRFFLDRSEDRPFRIDVGATPQGVLAVLAGFVDYAPVPLAVERKRGRGFITGVIPKRAYTRLTIISFLLGAMPPDKKSSDAEPTWLGFRFYSFSAG